MGVEAWKTCMWKKKFHKAWLKQKCWKYKGKSGTQEQRPW